LCPSDKSGNIDDRWVAAILSYNINTTYADNDIYKWISQELPLDLDERDDILPALYAGQVPWYQ